MKLLCFQALSAYGMASFLLVWSLPSFALDIESSQIIVKFKQPTDWVASSTFRTFNDEARVAVNDFGVGLMDRFATFDVLKGESLETAVDTLNNHPDVEYAQPNYAFTVPGLDLPQEIPPPSCIFPGFPPGCEPSAGEELPSEPRTGFPPAVRPEIEHYSEEEALQGPDPHVKKSWGLSRTKTPQAWEITRGSKEIIVAVLDSGVDYNHEDLKATLWRNPSPTKQDLIGYDFIHDDGLPFDDTSDGHGTHVAGIIGAAHQNKAGSSGVAPNVSIMPLKVISSIRIGLTSAIVSAIEYAVENGAKVINMSFGMEARGLEVPNRALSEAIQLAQDAGVLVVAAAGNEKKDIDQSHYIPAGLSHSAIISVVASTPKDEIIVYKKRGRVIGGSNWGKEKTDLAAPGKKIFSTLPHFIEDRSKQYGELSGTSMAAPHVSGAAALILSQHPEWSYRQVKETILRSVDSVDALKGKTASSGMLNVYKALSSTD